MTDRVPSELYGAVEMTVSDHLFDVDYNNEKPGFEKAATILHLLAKC